MSRALMSRMLVVVALTAVFFLRSDSRGDAPLPNSKPATASTDKPRTEAPAKPATNDAQSTTEAAVQHALAEPANFHFVDTPLKDVADFVADRYKISVLLDQRALSDAGITGNATFTESIQGVSLRSALHLLLSQHELGFVTLSESALLVTTVDEAKERTTLRVYDVRDLLVPLESQNEFAKPAAGSADDIINAITSTIDPASWDSNGGAGSIAYTDGALLIAQTDEIHRQIAKLFADLRSVAKEQAIRHGGSLDFRESQPADPVRHIRDALNTPMEFAFVGTRLGDVVSSFEAKLSIPIQLDPKTGPELAITPETPVTFTMKQLPAGIGLRQLLADKRLAPVIADETLLITTPERAKQIVHPVVYAVGDLCDVAALLESPGSDSLTGALTSTIAPASWDVRGGAGSIASVPVAKAIVCTQTDDIQQQVGKVLARLRADNDRALPAPATASQRAAPVVRIYLLPSAVPATPAEDEKARQLIGLVRKLIEPNGWADSSTYIGPGPGAIIVRQVPDVQKRIEQFLGVFGAVAYGYPARPASGSGISAIGSSADGLLPAIRRPAKAK